MPSYEVGTIPGWDSSCHTFQGTTRTNDQPPFQLHIHIYYYLTVQSYQTFSQVNNLLFLKVWIQAKFL